MRGHEGLVRDAAPEAHQDGGRVGVLQRGVQSGIRAFHGSPHRFDRFDISRIGTGEGNQAFGRGLYFAENEGVARQYREQLSRGDGTSLRIDGVPFRDFQADTRGDPARAQAIHAIETLGYSLPRMLGPGESFDSAVRSRLEQESRDVVDRVERDLRNWDRAPEGSWMRNYFTRDELDAELGRARAAAAEMQRMAQSRFEWEQPGAMYEVRLNVEPDRLLDLDEGVRHQPVTGLIEQMRDMYGRRDFEPRTPVEADWWRDQQGFLDHRHETLDRVLRDGGLGLDALRTMERALSPSETAGILRQAGVQGTRYLDGMSRNFGSGSHNYVLFDDEPVEIVRRYARGGLADAPGYAEGGRVGAAARLAGGLADALREGVAPRTRQNPRGLPMDEVSRRARAESLGYDLDDVRYHGTSADADFRAFRQKDRGVWTTTSPHEANAYALDNDSQGYRRGYGLALIPRNTASRVIPVVSRAENPRGLSRAEIDAIRLAPGASGYQRAQAQVFRGAAAEGHDAIDLGDGVRADLDARNLRVPHATFDPERAHEADLLASVGALGAGAGAAAAFEGLVRGEDEPARYAEGGRVGLLQRGLGALVRAAEGGGSGSARRGRSWTPTPEEIQALPLLDPVDPVVVPGADILERRRSGRHWLLENVVGGEYEADALDGASVAVPRAFAKEVAGRLSDQLIRGLGAIPGVIERGARYAAPAPPDVPEQGVRRYHYLGARVPVGGSIDPWRVVVREQDDGRFLAYDAGSLGAVRRNPTTAELATEGASLAESQRGSRRAAYEGLVGREVKPEDGEAPDQSWTGYADGGMPGGRVGLLQRGIRAFHGSPHLIDRFDISRIGSGEGSAAYGHGLYFAEAEDVARSYRNGLSRAPQFDGRPYDDADPRHRLAYEIYYYGGPEAAERKLTEGIARHQDSRSPGIQEAVESMRGSLARLRMGVPLPERTGGGGHMYEVRLGVDPDSLLSWDRPLADQPEAVQRFARDRLASNPLVETDIRRGTLSGAGLYGAAADSHVLPGGALMPAGRAAEASRSLLDAGIPGIRYLDAGSRGAGAGTSNFVMFDDQPIEIVRRYAAGGLAGVPASAGAPGPDDELAQTRGAAERAPRYQDGGRVGLLQRGIRAFHGSPHRFDRFDMSRIGTGEGGAAYGRGLYFAESEDVARQYRDQLSGGPDEVAEALHGLLGDYAAARRLGLDEARDPLAYLRERAGRRLGPVGDGLREVVGGGPSAELLSNLAAEIGSGSGREIQLWSRLDDAVRAARGTPSRGHMYEVDLRVDPASLLDWDRALDEQPRGDVVRGLVREVVPRAVRRSNPAVEHNLEDALRAIAQHGKDGIGLVERPVGVASTRLLERGIPGIRYLDAGSRGAGAGTSNFVMFDDQPIEIVRRYALGGLAGVPASAGAPGPDDELAQTRGAAERGLAAAAQMWAAADSLVRGGGRAAAVAPVA